MTFLNAKNLVFLSVVGGSSLYATLITPTTTGPVTVGAATVATLGSLTFLQAITANFNYTQSGRSGGTLSGSLETAVYRTSGGTLDFFYQIRENSSNTKSIADLGTPILDGYGIPTGSTSVYSLSSVTGLSQPTSGGSAFTASTRGATGLTADWILGDNSISWTLGTPNMGINNSVSTIFVVTTQATVFASDFASIQGGNVSTSTLGTAAPAPEPGFYGVLGIGLSGLAFMVVRRRLAVAPSKS